MFNFFNKTDINAGVKEYASTEGALLVDVREVDEFKAGRIPGSINVPLGIVHVKIMDYAAKKDMPLFLYCRSGNRSGQAAEILKRAGYTNVKNIGGIMDYTGPIEK